MPASRDNDAVPAAYQGREQAYIKHRLLEAYLQQLCMIVGMSSDGRGKTELCYVDCFAGPWLDESEGLGTTSIAISLRILEECRKGLLDRGKHVHFRALYVEQDVKAFGRLDRYLREHTPPDIETMALNGDFVDLRIQILGWCRSESFAFFFIDPMGWTEVGVEVLKPLLQRPQSEFLITFMYDFANRAAAMQDFQIPIAGLLGELPNVDGLSPPEREKTVLQTYRKNLRACMHSNTRWPARSAYVRVQDRLKNRTKYHLIYLTGHPLGIVKFMEISEKLDIVQKHTRAETRQRSQIERSGQTALFGASEFVSEEDGRVNPDEVEQFWLSKLSHAPRDFGKAEFADLLEETDWFPEDLQLALGRLIVQGRVVNIDAKRKRKTRFLHYDLGRGERLQLTGGKP